MINKPVTTAKEYKPKAENNSITLFKSPSEKSTISEANNANTP